MCQIAWGIINTAALCLALSVPRDLSSQLFPQLSGDLPDSAGVASQSENVAGAANHGCCIYDETRE